MRSTASRCSATGASSAACRTACELGPDSAMLELGSHRLPLGGPTLVMGIVNNTPDSFYDGGRHDGADAAAAHGRVLLAAGADVLDVGGQTGRLGAEIEVASRDRRGWCRDRGAGAAPASRSTRTARRSRAAALAAGASFVNDYTGGFDPELAGVVAAAGAGLVVTHYRGRPRSNPSRSYEASVDEVLRFLEGRSRQAVGAGVGERPILVDPGFGFGKSTRLDLVLLRDLSG